MKVSLHFHIMLYSFKNSVRISCKTVKLYYYRAVFFYFIFISQYSFLFAITLTNFGPNITWIDFKCDQNLHQCFLSKLTISNYKRVRKCRVPDPRSSFPDHHGTSSRRARSALSQHGLQSLFSFVTSQTGNAGWLWQFYGLWHTLKWEHPLNFLYSNCVWRQRSPVKKKKRHGPFVF